MDNKDIKDLTKEDIEEMLVDFFTEKGIEISLGGCGCCESPWLEIEIEGKTVLDCGNFSFSTTKALEEKE